MMVQCMAGLAREMLRNNLNLKFQKRIIPAFGLHPWYVEKLEENESKWKESLEEYATKIPGSIIGEIGKL